MSSFQCEHCATVIIDTPKGRIKGCEHYPTTVKIYMPEPIRQEQSKPSLIPGVVYDVEDE